MNSKTRALVQEIKKKVKSKITGRSEFSQDADIIALAVEKLYEQLKQQRVL